MVNKNQSPSIALVARAGIRTTGLGRYVSTLYHAFQEAGRSVSLINPVLPPLPESFYRLSARAGIDLRTVFSNYPIRTGRLQGTALCHITSQNLATLLRFQRLPPAIVTVHDLFTLTERNRGKGIADLEHIFNRLALTGVKRAHAIIADSEFTQQTIIDHLHYPKERIHVVYLSVDPKVFKPLDVPADFRAKYGLPSDAPIVLYVGSEDPRKNLLTLVEAFRLVCAAIPNAILVKAGAVHFHQEADKIREKVEQSGISNNVVFIEKLPDEDLTLLYNTADVFVLPSFLEGFGLPALEAMACGRAVIAANASSLPEVVGDAGLLFDPRSPEALSVDLIRLLQDSTLRHNLGRMALSRAKNFTLAQQASQTWDVYSRVLDQSEIEPKTATAEAA